MTATIINQEGRRDWSLQRDKEGHRDYRLTTLIRTDTPDDGPATVLNTPGLPAIGALWNFGNDFDQWAFAWPTAKIELIKKKGDFQHWKVEQKFSTRPLTRCQDENVEDPLLEPDRISGSFIKFTEESVTDRFGNLLDSSSHEMFRGPQVEFDNNRPTVNIEQNRAELELELLAELIDTVNDSPLWGLPKRTIKLSQVSWERVLFGVCDFFFIRRFTFDINFKTFDRNILDEGTKALLGKWNLEDGVYELQPVDDDEPGTGTGGVGTGGTDVEPDPTNPSHFNRYKDRFEEIARVVLDGGGLPAQSLVKRATTNEVFKTGPPAFRHVEKYEEKDLTLLGIPLDLEATT